MSRPFLSPSRDRFGAICASLAGIDDPAIGWCLLAERGAIPASWVDDPQRRFVSDPGVRVGDDAYGTPTRDPGFAPVTAFPSSIAECALFAADLEGVSAAEAAAPVLAERLAPWGAQPFTHVRWWTIPGNHFGFASQDTRPGVSYGLMFAFNALYEATPDRELSVRLFGNASLWANRWNELADSGGRVPERARLAGRAFADLPNPFEPLAAIEAEGYASLEWIGATGAAAGAVVLVSPAP